MVRVIVLCYHLLDSLPLIECVLSDFSHTCRTKVFDFRFVRVASFAEVLKVDVDNEVCWDDFVFVFADVFWTQLHLACFDVVSPLDEGRVKHDSENDLVGEPCVLEHYLYVTLQAETLLLLFAQQENHSWLLLTVLLLRLERERFPNVKTFAAVDLEKGNAATTRHVRNLDELDSAESLSGW